MLTSFRVHFESAKHTLVLRILVRLELKMAGTFCCPYIDSCLILMSKKHCLFTLVTENFVFNSEGVINRFTSHLCSGDSVFAQKLVFMAYVRRNDAQLSLFHQ